MHGTGAGPQTIDVCDQSSWYAVSDQPNDGGMVETYPDTEYDVGGRNKPSTTPISAGTPSHPRSPRHSLLLVGWDAAYDLWLNNWSTEIMIWNQWAGAQSYWPDRATISLTLNGVGYKFYDNNGELMFFRDTQVASGSVDILAAFQWLVSQGLVKVDGRAHPVGVRGGDLLHQRRGGVSDDGPGVQRELSEAIGTISGPDVTHDVQHHAGAQAIKLDRQLLQGAETLTNGALVLGRADDEQEAAAAGAGDLHPGRTG